MLPKIDFQFVKALVRRDLKMYFSNPTGYVFITLFIFLSAAAAFWQDRFFWNNLANLDQLNLVFPYLLLFFIPALTMSVWSEERKLGTDELLLTLPAPDLDVVLGKFLAALGIYTASLLLSLSHVLVLSWLGDPDWGLMFSNYLGYWFLGAAMIAAGLLGSLLTSNATIAFILGAGLCSLVIFLDDFFSLFGDRLGLLLTQLTVFPHFIDFSSGVLSFSGFLYFASVSGFFLYLNVLLLSRRHWPRQADGLDMRLHHLVRAVAVLVILVSVNTIVGRFSVRADMTAEGLHSLSDQTYRILDELPEDRPVFIQAFFSPEVPEHFVQTRETLVGMLNEIDRRAGSKVQVVVRDTEPFSEAAREARDKFGINPRQVANLRSARASVLDVFLGLAFTCGAQDEVIPFFDRGLPIEYEIVRSIRVAANTERKRVGLVTTALKVFGGLDFQTFQSSPAWSVVDELKKQYEIVQVSPGGPIDETLDGIVVVLPSSLPQGEMDNVKAFIKGGGPALLLVDPVPVISLGDAPLEQPGANTNPFMRQNQPPPTPKGNIQEMLADLGVMWNTSRVVWDSYNPHPDLARLPEEVVFLGRGNENAETFNTSHPASSGLQELVLLYPGHIEQAVDSDYSFQPLLKTGVRSGSSGYAQIVQRTFFDVRVNPNIPRRVDARTYVVAAHIKGQDAPAVPEPEGESEEGESEETSVEAQPARPVELIVVADLDFISEQFFQIRRQGPQNLNFDNVSFFLNCIDTLVGDDSFVALRNRRIQHRILTRLEEQTQSFVEQRATGEENAEAKAQKALEEAQRRLDENVGEVSKRTDLDQRTKQIMARNVQEVESRRFEVLKTNIEVEKQADISRAKEDMESQIKSIQNNIKVLAVTIPPIPVLALGTVIFLRRRKRENEGAAAVRRLREQR